MPVLDIMKEVGKSWQNLTPQEKDIHQSKADEDKLRYKAELKDFEKEVDKLGLDKSKPNKNRRTKTKKPVASETGNSPQFVGLKRKHRPSSAETFVLGDKKISPV